MSEQTKVLLEAGAVLPAGTAVAKDDTVDALSARRYRHPVLGERTIVRLVPATLGAAEDLSMEFLGFDKPESTEPVGVVRQQALGFPAWALVHDPANGHHALALVKEIERLARIAKSRTGAAKEGFDALGERLARSVPHFLPTFYEEAGRAFLAGDSTSYAASMFGKARDAERAYGLAIDEERQHAVFLEFALAGALTVKALTGHARDLAARCTPADAYERFRRLCVERTLGGLPPYAAMHTDLRRLAKAAKLDQAAADEQVLRDLFGAPATIGAPEQFWAAYRAPLAGLAAADPAIRGRLLGIFPKNCTDDTWLALLGEAGALPALTEPADRVAPGAASPDGPAGWLQRFDAHRNNRSWRDHKRSPHLLALLEQMAPRLKADGVPTALCRRYGQVDLDLVDACLALGVPLTEPHDDARYDVGHWLQDSTEGRRDLVALAGDGRFLDELVSGVEDYLGRGVSADRIRNVLSVEGLRTAVRVWLENLAREVGDHGLPTLGGHLDRLERLDTPEGLAVHADAARTVIEHDVAAVLARTLRAGVLDEFGWPALEQAVHRFDGVKVDETTVVEQWPHLIVRVGDLVQVVGPDRVEYEHLLRIPADERRYQWRQVFRWVDGQLLVCWDAGAERRGYWSGTPDDVFTVPDEAFDLSNGLSLPLPGGGRTLGGRPLHVGDRSERRGGPVLSDGSAYWVWRWRSERHELREFDPATGEAGRASLPAFLEDGAVDGEPLQLHSCRLHPGPAGSPLGARDGLVGWRVRERADGTRVGESVDGTAYTLPKDKGTGHLVGALRLPGGPVCGLTDEDSYRRSTLRLYGADGTALGEYQRGWGASPYARGTVLVPPAEFWHHLRPRDEAGSAALRTLSDERAAALMAAARTVSENGGFTTAAAEQLPDLIAPLLPEVTDPALRAGVGGVVLRAAALALRQHRLGETLAGRVRQQAAAPVTPAGVGDNELAEVLSGLIRYCYRRGDSAVRLLEAAGAALTAAEVPAERVAFPGDIDWIDSFGLLRPAMARAASPFIPDGQREALADLLGAAARSGLTAPGSALRRIDVTSDAPVTAVAGQVLTLGGRRQLVLTVDTDDRELTLLDHAPDGVFGALPGHTIDEEMRFDLTGADPASVEAFLAALAQHGPAPWRAEAPGDLSQRAGMSHAEATLLLAALPRRQWDRAENQPLREQLGGVDADALTVAARRWQHRDETVRMLSLMLPEDPAALWATGPAVDRVVAEWTERHGVRRPVRDELIVALNNSNASGSVAATELLHGIANPDTCRWLHGKADGIDPDDLIVALAKALPWLVYHLPAADPLRDGLPRVLELLRGRLRDPKLVIHAGHIAAKDIDGLARAVGATPSEGPDGVQAGALVFPPGGDWRHAHLRTGLLDGAGDPALTVLLAQVSGVSALVASLRAVLGDQIEKLVGYPVPDADGFAQDPSRSAPELVAEVAQATGLPADAAALYLQLLALPDPTDRNVAAWTGWKPARLKAARAALAASDLIVEAKRPRAGRSLFLPGGWLALKAPHLPLETWKYGLLIGGAQGPVVLGVVLPVAPAPQLFDLAWARVRQGDAPRFDELVTERRR
ncbi:DNA-binding protein [Catellatospora sp. TT07R-123]|uniref:hypothetical protein n=1 Tax=Catellatospora sp. TT07R-123 TaxID=2733863 RepID=UPI001B274951|nr:hypothetical protein [Catellatospora sp. TT07R-123]GHJ48737.1 DNA-binding protein [Catellatospora sp. TT07R-123]